MRIITDANIDNLLSMNYSDNINKLLHNDKSIDEIVPLYKKIMLDKIKTNNLFN